MPVSAGNRPIDFLGLLSTLSSVFPDFDLPLFPLCMSRISKFALKEQFLYKHSFCNLLFYFAVIILIVNLNCLKLNCFRKKTFILSHLLKDL